MVEIINEKDVLKTAIQMEKDGRSFYTKAAAQTTSETGRNFFESLAQDELLHLDVFQKLFENTISKQEWTDLVNSSKKYADIPIFPKNLQETTSTNPDTNELDALNIGMESEKEAIDYYGKFRDSIDDPNIKQIIEEIINQEKNHYALLEQEFYHLNKTGFWFELDYLGT